MSRQPGMLNLSGNIEVNAGAPLDSRSVVPTVADLTVAANFPYKYIGMRVTVQATGDMYTLMDNDVTDLSNWKKMGSGGDGQTIQVDELPTASSTEEGNIYQYIGQSTVNYTHGYFYECVEDDGSYSWEESSVQTKDYDDLTNRPVESSAVDMTEIIDPLPSDETDGVIYSTTERKIGRWIDGKPLYQKTVHTGALQNSDTQINIGITAIGASVSKVIKAVGTIYNSSNGYWGGIPAVTGGSSEFPYFMIPSLFGNDASNENLKNKACISMRGNLAWVTDSYVTVQYTKTTD